MGRLYNGGLTLFRISRSICTAPIVRLFFRGWEIFNQDEDVQEAERSILRHLLLQVLV